MMKLNGSYRFFLMLAMLAGAVMSCSKSPRPSVEEIITEPVPIRFTCGSGPSVTVKADDSFIGSNTLIENQHFAVFGWDTGDDFLYEGGTGPGVPDFWNGDTPVDVTFHDNDDKGKNNFYDPDDLPDMMDQYWPRSMTPAYCYSFWAYYPYFSGNGITVKDFADNPAGTVGKFDFEVQSDVADMVDFCVSDVANDIVYSTTNSAYQGTVALTFHHVLTRVHIKFERSSDVADGTTIQLVDAKLKNIYTQGVLTATYEMHTPTPGFGREGTTNFSWSAQAVPGDFEVTFGGENPTDGTPASYITLTTSPGEPSTEDIFLMIPQIMLTTDAAYHQDLYFKWSVDNGGGAVYYEQTVLLDECKTGVGQATLANIDWNPNEFITYTVVIGAKPIEFNISASIAPWSSDVNGYYPIIS